MDEANGAAGGNKKAASGVERGNMNTQNQKWQNKLTAGSGGHQTDE